MWDTLVRHRAFRRLCIAATVDAIGTWLLVTAVSVHVYAVTGSATSTALALAVQALPAVVVGPWAGALVDRWPRRIVLVVANTVAAAGVCALLDDRLIYAGLVVESVAGCFLRPAFQATIPAIVPDETDRASANALLAVSQSVLRLTAPLAGTFLTTAGWFAAVVAADAVSYLGAATILATLSIPDPARSASALAGESRAGWRLVVRTRLLRGMLAASCVYWTANAALTALLVPFVAHRLHAGGQAVGYLVTGLGAGYLCGSAISRTILVRFSARTHLAVSYALVGGCFLVMFTTTGLPVAIVAVSAAGIPGAMANVATTHHAQTAAPPEARGRVSAAFVTSDAVAAVTGALAAPLVVAATGLPAALIILSTLVLAAAAIAAVALPAGRPNPNQPPGGRPN